jgi:hypothetical protein
MVPVAAVLLLIVLVFSVAVVVSNPGVLDLSIFGAQVPVTLGGVFFSGAVTMLVVILAAALLRTGLRRSRAHRQEVRALKQAAGPARSGASTPRAGAAARAGKEGDQRGTAQGSSQPAAHVAQPAPAEPPQVPVQGQEPTRVSEIERAPENERAPKPAPAQEPETSEAERRALLEEAEELTGEREER